MSDRVTKEAEVWAPDQGGKIHSHVRAFHPGLWVRVEATHRPIAIVPCDLFIHQFIFLVLYAGLNFIDDGF